ncbi:Decarboxylase family protein [Salmonella bongori]|nr:Decarboxylase family protein [Salmonella bongori]
MSLLRIRWAKRPAVTTVIIIDDAAEVARLMKKAMPLVKENRRDTGDAYSFNWSIRISPDLQVPFVPSHENMANLKLYPDQPG